MKRHRLLTGFLSLLTALWMIGAVGMMTAAAAPGDDNGEAIDNEWYDYIYDYFNGDSSYEEPDNLSDLPEAEDGQVVEATAVAIPAVAVSDATLFSGIVMWLCVALGIAVIVGVLVSRRTRRHGG